MKALKTIVRVVAIVATVMSFIPGPWQPVAALVAAIATAASAALEIIAPTKARANARGSPTEYRLDPQAGIPYAMGRTQYAGNGVKRDTWGTDNQYQGFTTVYSLGPINGIESFTCDRSAISFSGSSALGTLAGFMWFVSQLGACPSPALATPVAGWPGVDANFKLSGLAASNWVLKFDTKGKKFTGGPPQPGLVFTGVKVYDPRRDSTYPGGSGSCRAFDESTYVYSDTPHLHALTFAMGRYQNGKKRMGIGFPTSSIDMAYFVNAANVDEANGWKVSGLIFSGDNKWNALKQIMEAGGGAPINMGAKLSGMQSAPKAAIATINSDQIVGPCSVTASQSIRNRINVGVPRYRSEAHGWETVTGTPCRVASYITMDGGERRRELDWTLVVDPKQAAQLTYYNLYNAREMGPIELSLKMRWVGIKPGDCLNVNVPELNLINQKVVCISRTLDTETGMIKARFTTETDGKHAIALAATGGAPPVPSLAYDPDAVPAAPTGWSLGSAGLNNGSAVLPSLRFTGGPAPLNVQAIEFAHRLSTDVDWSLDGEFAPDTTRFDTTAVATGLNYYGRIRYKVNGKYSAATTLGPITVSTLTAGSAVIANSVVGQGLLATRDSVRLSNSPPLITSSVGVNLTDANTITDQGIAAGFSGQGNLAVRDSVDWTNSSLVVNRPANLASLTGSETIDNRFIPLGQNIIVNSDYSKLDNLLYGWNPAWPGNVPSSTTTWGVNLNTDWYGQPLNAAYVFLNCSTETNTGAFDGHMHAPATLSLSDLRRWALPVQPGDRVFASMLVGTHRCEAQCLIVYYDKDGLPAGGDGYGPTVGYMGTPLAGQYGRPENYNVASYFHDVPSNARYAVLRARGYPRQIGSGSPSSYMFYTNMMLCKVAPGQTANPRYVPGPTAEPGAEITRWIQPPSQSTDFAYDYTGNTPQFSARNMSVKLMTANGMVTSGISWGLQLISGGYNGASPGATIYSPSGYNDDGTPYWAVANLQAAESVVEFTASYQGQTYRVRTTYKKKLADAPATNTSPGGGGSGPLTVASGGVALTFSGTGWTTVGTFSGTVPSGRTSINFNYAVDATPAPGITTNTFGIELRVLRNGSQIGGTASASSSYNKGTGEATAASFNGTIGDSGLTSGASVSYEIQMRQTGTPTRNHDASGSASAVAP